MKILNRGFISALWLVSGSVFAQETEITLEDLQAPSMPSATIIGSQFNEVSRPKSLKALEAALFSNYLDSDAGLTIPNNYALELNPFMLGGRKNFKYQDYLANEVSSNMWRNLSVSVSSTTDFALNDTTTSNAMGFGLRTIILNGEPKQDIKNAYLTALKTNQSTLDIKTLVRTLISKASSKKDTTSFSLEYIQSFVISKLKNKYLPTDSLGNVVIDSENEKKFVKTLALLNSVFDEMGKDVSADTFEEVFEETYDHMLSDAVLKKLKKELHNVKYKRYGLRWEVDGALALSFPTNEFDNSIVPRWGLWTNLSYQSETFDDFIFIGLGRMMFNNDDFIDRYGSVDESVNAGNMYDLGGRVVYQTNKLSVEIEYIHRFNRSKIVKIIDGEEFERNINSDTNKYLLNINYNLADNINISYSIGQNFDKITDVTGNLISGLSLNFGFGDIKHRELLSN